VQQNSGKEEYTLATYKKDNHKGLMECVLTRSQKDETITMSDFIRRSLAKADEIARNERFRRGARGVIRRGGSSSHNSVGAFN